MSYYLLKIFHNSQSISTTRIIQNATSQKTELSASLTPLAPRPLRARYIFARSKHLGKSVKEPGETHQKDKNSLVSR